MADRAYPTLGFDPAPGSPPSLDDVGQAWQRLGDHLGDQAAAVDALRAGLTWQGVAAHSCIDRLHVVPQDLHTAADACRSAGRAVLRYAETLRGLQQRAASLEAEAAGHARAVQQAAGNDDAKAGHRQLAEVLHRATLLYDETEAHASVVCTVLAAARSRAPHQPGWFHRMLSELGGELHAVATGMRDLVLEHAGTIAAIADWCSKAASVLAQVGFVASFVPGPGDALGGALIGLSIGLGATALAGHAALTAAGRGSWKAVAFDGAALTVSLVSSGMAAPIEREAEEGAAQAATLSQPWRDMPSMSQREFTLRAVRLHVDGAGSALGIVDLAHLPEDLPAMLGRRRTRPALAGAR